MQINNINTGEVIKITKIKENNIYYEIYENTYCMNNNVLGITKITSSIDNSYIPSTRMSISDAIKEAAQMKILEVEPQFELNSDIQNWLVNERNERIFVKNTFLNEKMLSDNNFKIVIDKLIEKNNNPELPKIIFFNNNTTCVYVNGIDEDDLPYTLPYILSGDIIIENKL